MKTIKVVAAIIRDGGRIFATQRGYGDWKDYWEFPGGKIEPGETPEEALVREIREELGAGIAVDSCLTTVEYDYPAFHLHMRCYLCRVTDGELTLKEHKAARWLSKDELDAVNWLPADRAILPLLTEQAGTKEKRPTRCARVRQLKDVYRLEAHPEGGWFAEVYTALFEKDGRALAGSIYFLLDAGERSQFHQIDCEEIWYYHEGCGLKIAVLQNGCLEEYLLGPDCDRGQRAMACIPKGAVFSAENLTPDGYTFVSCVTVPKFRSEGFRLVPDSEIRELLYKPRKGKGQSAGTARDH